MQKVILTILEPSHKYSIEAEGILLLILLLV